MLSVYEIAGPPRLAASMHVVDRKRSMADVRMVVGVNY
jgi:hypothetical protein